MWQCEEWRLTEAADGHEVLAWANAPDTRRRMFELFVEASRTDSPGLLRLAGSGPSDPERR
jgi:hypothetical protein